METCVQCGRIAHSKLYINDVPFLLQTGPFCSHGCKDQYKDIKAAKKERKAGSKQMNYESSQRAEELKLQKEILEKEESREIAAEKKEKARLKKLRIAELRAANRPVQARILENSDNLFFAFYAYVIIVFAGYAYLSTKHKEQYGEMAEGNPAKWLLIGSIIVFLVIASFILQKFLKEYFRKQTI